MECAQLGDPAHLLPPSWKAVVTAWLAEDTPSLDYGGFVVGETDEVAVLLGKAPVGPLPESISSRRCLKPVNSFDRLSLTRIRESWPECPLWMRSLLSSVAGLLPCLWSSYDLKELQRAEDSCHT